MMLTQFLKLFSVNLKSMFREKQVWFWNIFFPVILMVIFMVIFSGGDNEFKAKLALVDTEPSTMSEQMAEQLSSITMFEWQAAEPVSLEQANEWILDDEIDAAILLPNSSNANKLKLIYNQENESSATIQGLKGIINEFIVQANWAVIGVEPTYVVEAETISSAGYTINYKDFLLTGMIAMAIAQGGLFGMIEMVEMRKTGLLRRLRMTPVRLGLNAAAALLVRILLAIVQIVLLSLIGVFGFGATLNIDVPTLIVAFVIGVLAFNALGYLISSFSKTLEAYMGIANIASFLMIFLSGIFFPTTGFPDWLVPISAALPLTYFVDALRDGMVYASGILTNTFWFGLMIVTIWGVVAYGLGTVLYRRAKIETR